MTTTPSEPTPGPETAPGSTPPPPSPPPPPAGGYGAAQPTAGYGYQGGYPAAPAPGQLSPADERTWGMLAHLSALIASIVGLSFLGPLLVMLVQGPKSAYVRRQSVEALNFQITTYIAAIVSAVLVLVLIGILMLLAVGVVWLVLTIMASVAANRGEEYRYPINWRLVK